MNLQHRIDVDKWMVHQKGPSRSFGTSLGVWTSLEYDGKVLVDMTNIVVHRCIRTPNIVLMALSFTNIVLSVRGAQVSTY